MHINMYKILTRLTLLIATPVNSYASMGIGPALEIMFPFLIASFFALTLFLFGLLFIKNNDFKRKKYLIMFITFNTVIVGFNPVLVINNLLAIYPQLFAVALNILLVIIMLVAIRQCWYNKQLNIDSGADAPPPVN